MQPSIISSSTSIQSFSGLSSSKLMSFEQFKQQFKNPKLLYQHSSDIIQVYQYTEEIPSPHNCLVFVHHGTLLQTGRLFKKLIDNNKLMPNVVPYDEAYKDEEEYDATYYMVCRDSSVMNTYSQNQQVKTLEDVFNDSNAVNLLNDFTFLKHTILDIANGLRQLHRCELTHNNLFARSILLINNKNYDGTSRTQAKRAVLQFPGIGISYLLHVGSDINYAPEVQHHTEFSKDNDVFMFGLLILKILLLQDVNIHLEEFDWKKDIQEKITKKFGTKASHPFVRSLVLIAKECVLSNFRPTTDHLVTRLQELSEREDGKVQVRPIQDDNDDEEGYHDSFSSFNNMKPSHYFASAVESPHFKDFGDTGESDFQLHAFDMAAPVIIDMDDEDDDESETLSDEMFDKRRSRMSSSMSMSDPFKERMKELNPEEEVGSTKPTGLKKLFSCFFCGREDLENSDDSGNRIDLYANANIEMNNQNVLPDYLLEGKKKREGLFCEKLIKRGPNGSVILVKEEKTRTNLCMKKCTPGNDELFEREIKVLKQMDHPRISKFIDSFDYADDDSYIDHISKHIVMQYYPNGDLEECFLRKTQKTQLTPVLLTKILVQCFEALAYLEDRGWVHGNICPNNIVLDSGNNAVLVDFGFCLAKGEKINFFVRGSCSAPEHRIGSTANVLSDVFSVATVIAQLLTLSSIDLKLLKIQNTTILDVLKQQLGSVNYANKFAILLNHPLLKTTNIGEILRAASSLELQNRKSASVLVKDCAEMRDQVAAIWIQKCFRGYKLRKQYKDRLPKRQKSQMSAAQSSQSRREARRIKSSQSNYAISSISKSPNSNFGSLNRSSSISTGIVSSGISRSTSNYAITTKQQYR